LHSEGNRAILQLGMMNFRHIRSARLHQAVLIVSLLLLVLLRWRWIGHLLVWDEAMNLCAVRAFLAEGTDHFSNWFWRHPPLFCGLMLLLQPLKQGFAERVELLTITLSAVNALLILAINRKVFNQRVALWSVFFLAVMPGSVFFDVWVKRDLPAATFGLLAILLLLHRKLPFAAFSLGVAMLSKETGLFYAGGCALLWLFGVGQPRTFKGLVVLAVVPLLSCAWWYGWFSTDCHVDFAVGQNTGFNAASTFYLHRIVHDLGWLGVGFAVTVHGVE